MIDAKTSWGPSIHRNIHGKSDHALVLAKWGWRVRAVKSVPRRNWDSLDDLYSPPDSAEGDQVIIQEAGTPYPADVGTRPRSNSTVREQHVADRPDSPKKWMG